MAYEKQTWQTGDVITQEKLNHMEDGIAEGGDTKVYVIKCVKNDSTYTVDKSYDEITNAIREGYAVFILLDGTNGYDPTLYGQFLPLQSMNSGSYDFSCFRTDTTVSGTTMEVHEITLIGVGEIAKVQYKRTSINFPNQENN